jgi:diguanylate cyclase (GGDEF)-like protein/PAS domain S-box-containing protein
VVRPLKMLTDGAELARNSPTASLPKVRGFTEVTSLAESLDGLLTERKRAEDELRGIRAFLDAVVENIPAMLFVKEAREQRYVLFNRAGEELLGIPRENLIGKNDHELFPKREADLFEARDREVLRSGVLQVTEEERIDTRHNGLRLLRTKKIAISDDKGVPQYLLGISEDITDRKRAEARITHMAHHDAMTGLANRTLFRQRLEESTRQAREHSRGFAVLYVDLDGFKDVNDALGHPVGDTLLRIVADRLKSCVRDVDTVARLGGDEFAIIQHGVENPEETRVLAQRLVDVIGQPYRVEEKDVVVSVSVGVATAPGDSVDPESLRKFADMALYSAKTDGGRTFRFFDPDMNVRLQARRMLERDLRAAFARDEFELHYQPSINLATGAIGGFEALVRWNHADRGMISPAEFIPIAEDSGLIEQLGEWVLHQACAEAARWPGNIRVAVNLSPAQFKSRNLVQAVLMALASSGLAADRLELEITESVLLQENENNMATLHQLKGLGTRIALDDFGTGYSSLSYLRMFPFDRIKIDRSFVKELPDNAECVMIIRAMVDLAKGLKMATTAEGIETPEQLERLRANGCTEGQGFLFSRPRPAADLAEILARCGHFAERAA